jgi:DNA-binding transcriptional ArsR family regulator
MPLRTLQIAILGGSDEAVLVGLRNFPAHKLVLIVSTGTKDQADQLARKLMDTLKLAVDIIQVKDESVQAMLDAVGTIVSRETDGFQDFLINVGSAGKHLTCAGVTAAFVHGIRAFDVMGERLEVLPVMKFSYTQAVTEPKLAILRAIERSGGDVESLEKLSAIAKYGKPLLSYHIRGSPDSKGLEELGLVEVERGKRGRLRVKLTALGRTLLSTAPIKPSVSLP